MKIAFSRKPMSILFNSISYNDYDLHISFLYIFHKFSSMSIYSYTTVSAQPSLPMSVEAIHGVVSRVKDDPNIPEKEKIDTLCLLVQRYVVDNQT